VRKSLITRKDQMEKSIRESQKYPDSLQVMAFSLRERFDLLAKRSDSCRKALHDPLRDSLSIHHYAVKARISMNANPSMDTVFQISKLFRVLE